MVKTGVLVHARHPTTTNWEELVWGVPAKDVLGDLPKLVELVLREAADEPIVTIVVGTSAAKKDGLREGDYTKKFLLDHFDDLAEFPTLKRRLEALSAANLAELRARLEGIVVTPILQNTNDEVRAAVAIFKEQGIEQVIQITAASHGPRCVQAQSIARAKGLIPKDQLWFVLVTDLYFKDSGPLDTLVLEEPHRGDDPMHGFKPSAPAVLRGFLSLTPENKKVFLLLAERFIREHQPKR